VTRPRKLREVLNVRLDEPLAREIGRIAATEGRSESEVARSLLGYGIEVARRLQADAFSRPFAWREDADDDPFPGVIEIAARWRPMTEDEIDAHGLRGYAGYSIEDLAEADEHAP
jgi:hypothetical protein